MVKYSVRGLNKETSAKASAENLTVHFKNIVEVAQAVKHKTLTRAKAYLKNVLAHKEAIPINTHKLGRGRHAQGKNVHATGGQVAWPKNATKEMLKLLENAEKNASAKGLDADKLKVSHCSVNQAPKTRRRTYRAHGRIGPYMATPSHVNMVLTSEKTVKKAAAKSVPTVLRRRAAARGFVKVGGGVE